MLSSSSADDGFGRCTAELSRKSYQGLVFCDHDTYERPAGGLNNPFAAALPQSNIETPRLLYRLGETSSFYVSVRYINIYMCEETVRLGHRTRVH